MMMPFQASDDPLGLAVKGRARERRLTAQMRAPQSIIGPLPDPNWDGYFQAVDEAAGGRRVKFDNWGDEAPDLSRDPAAVASQVNNMNLDPERVMQGTGFNAPSQQLGTPISLRALRKGRR